MIGKLYENAHVKYKKQIKIKSYKFTKNNITISIHDSKNVWKNINNIIKPNVNNSTGHKAITFDSISVFPSEFEPNLIITSLKA